MVNSFIGRIIFLFQTLIVKDSQGNGTDATMVVIVSILFQTLIVKDSQGNLVQRYAYWICVPGQFQTLIVKDSQGNMIAKSVLDD